MVKIYNDKKWQRNAGELLQVQLIKCGNLFSSDFNRIQIIVINLLLVLQIYIFTTNKESSIQFPMLKSSNQEKSYEPLLKFTKNHYENFPVVSFLLPAGIQKHVAAIYWFARTADDIADEGEYPPSERIDALDRFEERFNSLLKGKYESDYEDLLNNTIISNNLSPKHFTDLISAFKQDVVKKSYKDYNEVLDYCRRSANPVGRLMLELYNIRDENVSTYSDNICTALQITNFIQDAKTDYEKGRIYFAADEMRLFGVDEKVFEMNKINDNLKQLAKFYIERNENLFQEGKRILNFLKGRFKYEIKWTIGGGETILNKIRKNDYDIFIRPKLNKTDFTKILIKSFLK